MPDKPRIAILISFSGQGGVERMICHLAGGFLAAGYAVDLLLIKAKGEHVRSIPPGVNVIKLKAQNNVFSLPEVMAYVRKAKPAAMLAAKHRAIKTAAIARLLTGGKMRLVGRLGTTVSGALEGQNAVRKLLWYSGMRFYYRLVDRLVAVSQGVADDVIRITGLSADKLAVIHNPVIVPGMQDKAKEPVSDPWLTQKTLPVLLAAGRFTRQKDFATLLDAFAILVKQKDCRLIILGEGKLRGELERHITRLGLAARVSLPGFAGNPYAYMSRCDMFVLSSLWEGSPNVLKEALALGLPVVATDCPSGPKEILQNGRFGPLVPMGDAQAMAAAMLATLNHPLPAAVLQEAVRDYTLDASTRGYLRAMQLPDTPV